MKRFLLWLALEKDLKAAGGRRRRLQLFALRPPGIVFFDAEGREIKGLRVIGCQSAERFLKTLSLARGF